MNSLEFAITVLHRAATDPQLRPSECRVLLLVALGKNTGTLMEQYTHDAPPLLRVAATALVKKGFLTVTKVVDGLRHFKLTPAGVLKAKNLIACNDK